MKRESVTVMPRSVATQGATARKALERVLLENAFRRVGSTPEQRFGWLQDFLHRDVNDATSARWAGSELLILATESWGVPPESPRPNKLGRLAAAVRGVPQTRWTQEASLLDENPVQEVNWIQHNLQRELKKFAVQRRWELPQPKHTYAWTEAGTIVTVPIVDASSPADLRAWVFGSVFNLLATLSHRLRVCAREQCQDLFLPRGRQSYCTKMCSTRVRQDRFRQRHPEEDMRAARHAAYVRKRKRALSTKVRVQRQRRLPPSGGDKQAR